MDNIFGHAVLLIFLIATGFLMGYFEVSVWWAIIPMLIGGFWGAYMSPFAKVLIDPRANMTIRNKALTTLRWMTFGWTVLSGIFLTMGYSFLYFVHN